MARRLGNHYHAIFKIHVPPAKAKNLPAAQSRQDGEKSHRLVGLGKLLIKRPELLRRERETFLHILKSGNLDTLHWIALYIPPQNSRCKYLGQPVSKRQHGPRRDPLRDPGQKHLHVRWADLRHPHTPEKRNEVSATEVPIKPTRRKTERGQNIRFESLHDKSLECNHHLGFVCVVMSRKRGDVGRSWGASRTC